MATLSIFVAVVDERIEVVGFKAGAFGNDGTSWKMVKERAAIAIDDEEEVGNRCVQREGGKRCRWTL